MLRDSRREYIQQKGKVSWERRPDVVDGIVRVVGEGNDKAKNNWGKPHGL